MRETPLRRTVKTQAEQFAAAIDLANGDSQVLLPYADWLEESGDAALADAYRALGWRRLWPWYFTGTENWCWFRRCDQTPRFREGVPATCFLPEDWFDAVEPTPHVRLWAAIACGEFVTPPRNPRYGPRVLFKAAAKGFVRLGRARRDELLRAA